MRDQWIRQQQDKEDHQKRREAKTEDRVTNRGQKNKEKKKVICRRQLHRKSLDLNLEQN